MRLRWFVFWVALCAVAEFLGIAWAALWFGGMHFFLGELEPIPARVVVWIAMSMAAIPEGVILGGLQAEGVKWFLPDLSAWRWMLATIAVGFLGWGVGTFIPLFLIGQDEAAAGPEPGLAATAAFAAIFGLAVGAVFGLAQAWALPEGSGGKLSWVIANTVGWAIGLPLIYMAAQIAGDYSSWTAKIGLWAVGGLGAGMSVGAATGIALLKLDRNELSPNNTVHMVKPAS